MATQIFVNLPVQSLRRSIDFFKALGFGFDPQFTDDKGTCMIVGENSFVMLLARDFFQSFTPKDVADASKTTEVLIAISRESREAVDALVARAVAAGATAPRQAQDHGFMYQHGFHDLDGHVWELLWMRPQG
jgi:predicted lactoylglutathione lyase